MDTKDQLINIFYIIGYKCQDWAFVWWLEQSLNKHCPLVALWNNSYTDSACLFHTQSGLHTHTHTLAVQGYSNQVCIFSLLGRCFFCVMMKCIGQTLYRYELEIITSYHVKCLEIIHDVIWCYTNTFFLSWKAYSSDFNLVPAFNFVVVVVVFCTGERKLANQFLGFLPNLIYSGYPQSSVRQLQISVVTLSAFVLCSLLTVPP